MTQKRYKKLLSEHDWYWVMSDSPLIREKGHEAEAKLKAMWKENPKLEALYTKHQNSVFNPKQKSNASRVNSGDDKSTKKRRH